MAPIAGRQKDRPMAYQVSWIVQHRVLYVRESGRVTLDDIRESTKLIADYMDDAYANSAALVIGIIDLRESKFALSLRTLANGVQNIASVVDPRHWKAKPGFVVLVTTGESAKYITSLVIGLSKQPMTTVATIEEALMVVRYMYPELQTFLDEYIDQFAAGTPH